MFYDLIPRGLFIDVICGDFGSIIHLVALSGAWNMIICTGQRSWPQLHFKWSRKKWWKTFSQEFHTHTHTASIKGIKFCRVILYAASFWKCALLLHQPTAELKFESIVRRIDSPLKASGIAPEKKCKIVAFVIEQIRIFIQIWYFKKFINVKLKKIIGQNTTAENDNPIIAAITLHVNS